jgi:tryptophan-rich sensory protein
MLYAMMGVAAGLVWARIDDEREICKKHWRFRDSNYKCLVVVFVFGLHNPMLAN